MCKPRKGEDGASEGKLPITAIIPVFNCGHRMQDHMEKSMEWLPEVAEIVVVDSNSADDTLAIIKQCAGHLNPRIISHPPGLYASWNRGVAEAACPFVYFSTVGDYITLEGLEKLLHTMQELRADVVISPPEFTFESTDLQRKYKGRTWPIHDIIARLKLNEPELMDPELLYDFILVYLDMAILGSSASNLYRSSMLKEKPFSDAFHSVGDSAWMIEHNFEIRTAIYPETFSTYLFHKKDWDQDEGAGKRSQALRRKLAYRAHTISLEQAATLCPDTREAAKAFIEQGLGNFNQEVANQEHIEFLENTIQGKTAQEQSLLNKLRLINSEVELCRYKEIDKRYRNRLSLMRLLWPPAMINRLRRKQLQHRISKQVAHILPYR